MICARAANSAEALAQADARLLALVENFPVAYGKWGDLEVQVDEMRPGKPPGYEKADREREEAYQAFARIEQEIVETRATTLKGVSAKLRCAEDYNGGRELTSMHAVEEVALSIFQDLKRLAQTI